MKRKELKALAKKIAEAEYIIQTSDNSKERLKAQDEILELSGKVTSLEEMLIIDELVQDILSEKIWLLKKFLLLYLHKQKLKS